MCRRWCGPDDAIGAIDWAIKGRVHDGVLTLDGIHLRGGAGWQRQVPLGSDDTAAVGKVTAVIASQLGLSPPEQPPYHTLTAAYTAYLNARAAERRNDYDAVATDLTRAFDLDPDLVEGRSMHLAWLSGTNQREEVERVTDRLLKADQLNPRQRAYLQARRLLARGETAAGLRGLEVMTREWPFFADAQNALMARRFHSRRYANLEEVERLARRALAFFPRGEHAASRLVRSMAFRGKGEAAKAALLAVGLTPEVRLANDVWAELYLYTADYANAEARFSAALAKAPHDVYARNMRYIAQILSGQCQTAANGLLEDFAEHGVRDEMAIVGWVARLTVHALVCQQDWTGARRILDRWAKATDEGRNVALEWGPRLLHAQGASAAEVLAAVEAGLAAKPSSSVHASLLRTLARVAQDPERIERAAQTARAQMNTADNARVRTAWSLTQRMLTARLHLMRGHAEAIAEHARLIPQWSQVRREGELELVMEAMALHALALEHAEQPTAARAAWHAITALDYPRSRAMDLVMLAQAHLK